MPDSAHHANPAQAGAAALEFASTLTRPMPSPSIVSKTCTISEAITPLATADQVQPAASIEVRAMALVSISQGARRTISGLNRSSLGPGAHGAGLPTKQRTCAMAKKEPKQLDALFLETLKDIYFAEKKILTALPKMKKAAQSEDLAAAFEKHRKETEGHVDRLEQVFKLLGEKPKGKTCAAILGITEEADEVAKDFKGSPALDAGLLAAAQAVEHYEISRYGTLKAWATKLNNPKAAKLIDQTLAEEKKTDQALTELAESAVNQEAEAA
jgi:ferritin-like metal-binding protein YciE